MKNYYLRATGKILVALALMAMPVVTVAQLDSAFFVSDSTWSRSTTVTPSDVNGAWNGVGGVLPDTSTYTLPVEVGHPYGYFSIDSIDGADVLKTDSSITYFRKVITLDTLTDLSARVRINVDDQTEVYINGILFLGEYEGTKRENWKNPYFDVLIEDDGTINNGYLGGDSYDSITDMDMDDVFQTGENEIVFVCRNLANFNNKGGFRFRLDLKGTPGLSLVEFIVSDSTGFKKSTVVTPSMITGSWDGVSGALPPDSTFTLPAEEGQPYGYTSMSVVPDAKNIITGPDITYFRCTFDIVSKDSLNARFRMMVDDGMEIYLNDFLIAREGNVTLKNYRLPAHDVKFFQNGTKSNGFMGGDMYDFTTSSSMGDVFVVGTNELILAIRNQPYPSDRGGFSFRLDLDDDGAPVIVDNKTGKAQFIALSDGNALTADVFPNPSNGALNVVLEDADDFDVHVLDMNGRILSSNLSNSYHAGLDISGLAPGIYMVRVESADKSYTTKVVKR